MMSKKWSRPDQWHVSQINYDKNALEHCDFPADRKIKVVDSTIRRALT